MFTVFKDQDWKIIYIGKVYRVVDFENEESKDFYDLESAKEHLKYLRACYLHYQNEKGYY